MNKVVIYAMTAEARAACLAYCAEHSITEYWTPPTMPDALTAACLEQCVLLAHRLPDLADSLKGLRDLTRRLNAHGAAWATVAESLSSKQKPVGKLLEAMAVIEHEAHVRKGQRAASARKGKVMTLHPGKVRYGYRLVDGQLVEDEYEQRVVRFILSCHKNGYTTTAIIEVLTLHGYKPRGKRWFPDTITKVLKREAQEQTQ